MGEFCKERRRFPSSSKATASGDLFGVMRSGRVRDVTLLLLMMLRCYYDDVELLRGYVSNNVLPAPTGQQLFSGFATS